ncbi:hypothetical protein BMS3Bbin02_01355 [bacterium BMS3Bbin02]|nr:hypothetical protein BMS3Bbin02_01355 [bacterium BMS3Bbin02]
MNTIGILAYGSLVGDPGPELAAVTRLIIDNVPTPFGIEYARSSRGRGGAPTLIPVDDGGVSVNAKILLLDNDVAPTTARDMLWRRETNRVGSDRAYAPPSPATPNTVIITDHPGLANVELVLATKIGANFSPLTPQKLAELAIESAASDAGSQGRDGISYLINARNAGIITPLTARYEQEILKQSGTDSLSAAWQKLTKQSGPTTR